MKLFPRVIVIFLWLFSIGFLIAAAGIAYSQYTQFSQVPPDLPAGSVIAGIPVGGLDQSQAVNRLVQAYSIPVELRYGDAVIQARPETLGFTLDLTSMLAEAQLQRSQPVPLASFWDYLWNRFTPGAVNVPLKAGVDEERIRAFLKNEVAARYDLPASAALPVAGTVNYRVGSPGTTLEVEPAVPLIRTALFSLTKRTVSLTSAKVAAQPALIDNLKVQLRQLLDQSGYPGIAEIYLQNLKTHQEIHFAYQAGKLIPADISFTAASTIKIAIMIATFRRTPEPAPQSVLDNLARMIEASDNDSSDALMKRLDSNNGPLIVTQDLQALGLKNTFLAGFFYPGAPLLKKFSTPANQRKDFFIDPDPYNQTTPAEIGQLLADIYQCADTGSGPLTATFPGEISQAECKQMVEFLKLNKMPYLITAGLPDGTPIAHKHGWVTELDGVVHLFSDAALIYSPGGSYVLTVYLWTKDQLLLDVANPLTARLSNAVYNYFNLEN